MAFSGRMSMARVSQQSSQQSKAKKEDDGDAFMTLVRAMRSVFAQFRQEHLI